MLPTNRVTEHPGKTLRQLLEEHGLTQTAFAKHAGMTLARLNEIVAGKRAVTPETAWILGQAFRQSPEFWMGLQTMHDLTKARVSARKVRPVVPARRAA
jgi:antitoxin HigA-1